MFSGEGRVWIAMLYLTALLCRVSVDRSIIRCLFNTLKSKDAWGNRARNPVRVSGRCYTAKCPFFNPDIEIDFLPTERLLYGIVRDCFRVIGGARGVICWLTLRQLPLGKVDDYSAAMPNHIVTCQMRVVKWRYTTGNVNRTRR